MVLLGFYAHWTIVKGALQPWLRSAFSSVVCEAFVVYWEIIFSFSCFKVLYHIMFKPANVLSHLI